MEADAASPDSVVVRRRVPVRVRRALLEDVPFLFIVTGFTATALVMRRTVGVPAHLDLHVSWNLIAIWTALYSMPAILGFLTYGVVKRHRSLFRLETWRSLVSWFLDPSRTLSFLLIFASLPIFMTVFVAFKASIPAVQPFVWDVRFTEWDRLLHFGLLPWQILQPLLGRPAITKAIDFGYYLWFPALWMTVIWQAWHGDRDSNTRSQFLVSFAACWILLGVVAATLFSSAGPVYFAAVTGVTDPYAPLIDYLQAVNAQDSLRAVWAQDLLWQTYTVPGATRIEGISAMPSLHVSMVVLLTLVGFRTRRWLGWVYAAFAGLILVGSVHLAWHYAIDAYAAAAGTLVIWWVSGIGVTKWRGRIGLAESPPIRHD